MEMQHNANENSHPHAGSYLRYSSGRQAYTYSVGTQRRVIEEACTRQGWSVLFYYEDEIEADSTAEEKDGDETTESK